MEIGCLPHIIFVKETFCLSTFHAQFVERQTMCIENQIVKHLLFFIQINHLFGRFLVHRIYQGIPVGGCPRGKNAADSPVVFLFLSKQLLQPLPCSRWS